MKTERHSQWLRGVLDLCVLGLLAEGESYGYRLGQALEDAGLGTIRGGTLYPVLLRLERGGLIAARWSEGDAGPARKYYRLTPPGKRELRAAAGEWADFTRRVSAVLEEVEQ
ncbi:PadR family transcriptional regulator (plasmid) [Embleya sp. NBC_00888]|uniref:PadR family transcriptional regulator n=1 Tax=Embleya sp. NBC_00888 TaxID=2975960 RepID=UPI002F919525|nr:PadR family transcriptional regulator [Embleya sp. NBC_00888]